ncbi:MAG: hypothetical protein P1P76_10825 [Anaerolineales bacterium]|nr:hypothetical protein [Anaerolineales bacterium]
MKKVFTFNLLAITMLVLAACAGGTNQTTNVDAVGVDEQTEVQAQPSGNEDQLSLNQLVLGTMRLEDTELAVTADQASELLTLWKAYRSLSESDTAAQVEMQALMGQIESAMTGAQIESIRAMEIKPEDISALVEELGLQPEDRPEGAVGGFFPGAGQGGGPGAGAGGGPGAGMEGEVSPEMIATAQAMRAEQGGAENRMSSFLITPLIELLESKVAS